MTIEEIKNLMRENNCFWGKSTRTGRTVKGPIWIASNDCPVIIAENLTGYSVDLETIIHQTK